MKSSALTSRTPGTARSAPCRSSSFVVASSLPALGSHFLVVDGWEDDFDSQVKIHLLQLPAQHWPTSQGHHVVDHRNRIYALGRCGIIFPPLTPTLAETHRLRSGSSSCIQFVARCPALSLQEFAGDQERARSVRLMHTILTLSP